MGNASTPRALSAGETTVTVPTGTVTLEGTLAIPDGAIGRRANLIALAG